MAVSEGWKQHSRKFKFDIAALRVPTQETGDISPRELCGGI